MYFLPSFEPLLHPFLVLADHVAVFCLMNFRMTRITQTLEIGILKSELPHLAQVFRGLYGDAMMDASSCHHTSLRSA